MHYTADFCIRHYAGFLQIGSQLLYLKLQQDILHAVHIKYHFDQVLYFNRQLR